MRRVILGVASVAAVLALAGLLGSLLVALGVTP